MIMKNINQPQAVEVPNTITIFLNYISVWQKKTRLMTSVVYLHMNAIEDQRQYGVCYILQVKV